MAFTDLFIRRPVLASVVSLLILVVGLRAFFTLQVLEFPKTENAVITISTTYYGADAETMAGFVTTPLEAAIAQANGIDYMTSVSQAGLSTITLNLVLNYDANRAMTEVNAKINAVLNQLPNGVQQPTMTVKVGQSLDALIIGFASDVLAPNQVTDYLVRNVIPQLQSVEGVQTAELLGGQNFAMRAWLDPDKLAAYGVTASDVSAALVANDYIAGLGNTKGQMVQVNLTGSTGLHTLAEFRNLIVKQTGGAIIRLGDVAHVTLGADNYDSAVSFDGKNGVYIGIQTVPSANLLSVIAAVKKVLPGVLSQLPAGLHGAVIYDSTAFVNSSIREVARTLAEALVIVTLVVFAFLGSPRSVVIPVVAIPLSLVGTFAMMLLFGFSVNLLTLLALVLAIGLVVDDAIIVVESVNRHLEEGMLPIPAAMKAAADLANPIIAMTVVLIAVYVPIGFQSGLTGALFTEFAFTLVGAVTISAIVALTLSPMMCSRLLRPHAAATHGRPRLVDRMERGFGTLRRGYERRLNGSLDTLPVMLLFTAIVLVGIYFLYTTSDQQLAPDEDQGVVILVPFSSPTATLQQKLLFAGEVDKILRDIPEQEHTFQVEAPTMSIAGVTFKPWDQRTRNATTIQRELQGKLARVAGQHIVVFLPPALPGSSGLPIQFVIKTTRPFADLYPQAQAFLAKAQASGLFMFLDSDLKIDLPQATVEIDRDKASQLGLNMSAVGGALANLLGGGYVNYFSLASRSYKVIPQVQQRFRLNPNQVLTYTVANANGVPVPLSAIARIRIDTVPETLNHFQQLNAATISGVAAPGVSQAAALRYLNDLAARSFAPGTLIDYGGQLRQFVQESSGFLITFAFALIVIFLSLAALFESFRDPFIILISVPMSLAGALLFINLGFVIGVSLNIYTEVGLVTLMGLISKHGILMVEVANELQIAGHSKREAIVLAAGIRLRPILMTTAAMVLGVVPLIAASGAGAASRFNMGLVIATGLAIGTLFTLFVLPAVYLVAGADHAARRAQ